MNKSVSICEKPKAQFTSQILIKDLFFQNTNILMIFLSNFKPFSFDNILRYSLVSYDFFRDITSVFKKIILINLLWKYILKKITKKSENS